jgi:signal transduction histidine kinase
MSVSVIDHVNPEVVGHSGIWLEVSALVLTLSALLVRSRQAAGPESRFFWGLLATAYVLWIFRDLLLLIPGARPVPAPIGFTADLSYAFLYLAILLALEFRPHQGSGWLAHSRIAVVEMVGGFAAVFALFAYFVLAPMRVATSTDWVTPYPLYLFLDSLILFGLVRNLRSSLPGPWVRIYRLLLAAAVLLLLLDGLALFAGLQLIDGLESAFLWLDTGWMLLNLCVVTASRVRLPEGVPAAGTASGWSWDPAAGKLRRSSLIVYALALPALHLSLSVLGWIDEATRSLREVTLLGCLMVFGALALIHLQRVETERSAARDGCRGLLEASPVMILLAEGTDRPRHILNCNPLFAATLGSDTKFLVGRELDAFLDPAEPPGGSNPPVEEPWEAQLRLGEGAGLPVLVLVRRLPAPEPQTWLVTLADLSRQKVLEERLRQAQKLEALGRLAGGVAHDFNNILMVVEGYSTLLMEKLADQPELLEHAREVQSAARRAAHLVQQLLAFGRRQMLRPTRTRLNREVARISQVLRSLLRPEIQLVMKLEAVSDEVRIDVRRLQDVLLNLVSNAQDAIAGSGVVCVATRDVTPDEAGELGGSRGFVALEVTDTGSGIPKELHEKIFEPFYTTKGPGKASGLGLSSVLGIVEQSGGRISVDSMPGAGSSFRILLPVCEAGTREAVVGTGAGIVSG